MCTPPDPSSSLFAKILPPGRCSQSNRPPRQKGRIRRRRHCDGNAREFKKGAKNPRLSRKKSNKFEHGFATSSQQSIPWPSFPLHAPRRANAQKQRGRAPRANETKRSSRERAKGTVLDLSDASCPPCVCCIMPYCTCSIQEQGTGENPSIY